MKVVSDGTPGGTFLIDTESGDSIGLEIGGITAIEWRVGTEDAGAECVVTFVGMPIEVLGFSEEIDDAEDQEDS